MNLPAVTPGKGDLSYSDMFQLANLYSQSTMFPAHLQRKPADCFIVVQLAERLKADHFLIAQSTYVVSGKPGMEAKLIIALINRSGLFKSGLRYKLDGEGNARYATAFAEDKQGNFCEATYKMQTAIDEGLVGKNGSKYKTMPDTMLCYRAATLFARLHCPDVIMGMNVLDDNRQIIEVEATVVEEQPREQVVVPVTSPEDDGTAPATPERDPLEPVRAAYKGWSTEKKAAFDRRVTDLTNEGVEKIDAHLQAFEHTNKYFQ